MGLNAGEAHGRIFCVLCQNIGSPRDDNARHDLLEELGVSRTTLYAHVTPNGELTEKGHALLKVKANGRASIVTT